MRYLIAVLLTVQGLAAHATTVRGLSLPELAATAESVILGRCLGVRAQVVGDQPFLVYRFAVDETIKGPSVTDVEVHVPGGLHDGLRDWYAGMPRFYPGNRAVVFLTGADSQGYAWPVGLGQGHFRVIEQSESGRALVYQELDGLSRIPAGAAKLPAPVHGLELGVFLAQVRGLVAEAGTGAADESR